MVMEGKTVIFANGFSLNRWTIHWDNSCDFKEIVIDFKKEMFVYSSLIQKLVPLNFMFCRGFHFKDITMLIRKMSFLN